jgi:hypothetical protein
MGNKTRKILLMLIILVMPLVSSTNCKKQPKCGCSGDKINTITDQVISRSTITYNDTGTNAYFFVYTLGGVYYDTYYFCNPSDMYAKYKAISSDSEVMLSGDVYWDCSFVSSASSSGSSSYYYAYYKIYNIEVTDIKSSMYGK